MKILKIIGSVALALTLAFGWNLTGYLKDVGKLSNQDRFWILVFLGAVFSLQQLYLAVPKPVDPDEIEKRQGLIHFYLQSVHATYYDILTKLLGPDVTAYPVVRIHLMLPTYRRLGVLGSRLKVYYYYCPSGVIYSPAELDLAWKKKEGTCGWAWAKHVVTAYDSVMPELVRPIHQLDSKKHDTIGTIKSVISFPLWHNGRVVGVLGLDSKENISRTMFLDKQVLELFKNSARVLSTHCPLEGVRA